MQQVDKARNHISGAQFGRRLLANPERNGNMVMDAAQAVAISHTPLELTNLGLDVLPSALKLMTDHHNISVQQAMDMIVQAGAGMDAAGQPNITAGSIVTPIQFLQEFYPVR